MSLRAYAYLFWLRRVLQIAAVAMASGCLPFGFDIGGTLVLLVSSVVAPCCATYLLTRRFSFGVGNGAPEDEVTVDDEAISATQGSRAPVRFARLVEVGIVDMGHDDEMLYFLRASDGAWCAFPTERADDALEIRLRALEGFAPSRGGRELDRFAYWSLWRVERTV